MPVTWATAHSAFPKISPILRCSGLSLFTCDSVPLGLWGWPRPGSPPAGLERRGGAAHGLPQLPALSPHGRGSELGLSLSYRPPCTHSWKASRKFQARRAVRAGAAALRPPAGSEATRSGYSWGDTQALPEVSRGLGTSHDPEPAEPASAGRDAEMQREAREPVASCRPANCLRVFE